MPLSRRLLALALLVPCLAITACDADGGADSDPDAKNGQEVAPNSATWADDIKPMLTKYCASCHAEVSGSCLAGAGLCFLSGDWDPNRPAEGKVFCPSETWAQCAVKRLENGTMPTPACTPGAPGCPTADELHTLKGWVAAGAP